MIDCWNMILEDRIKFYTLSLTEDDRISFEKKLIKNTSDIKRKFHSGYIDLDYALEKIDDEILFLLKKDYSFVHQSVKPDSLEQCIFAVRRFPHLFSSVFMVNSSDPEDCIKKLKNKIKINKLI